MTKGSLTETQTMLSAPLALRSSARMTNPGRWWSEQVGVNAPGTAKRTTLPFPSTSAEVVASGPFSLNVSTFQSAPLSPTEIAMGIAPGESGFAPSSARRDKGGFLYGRSVFDPLAIVTATGAVQPYLAQSI